MTDRSDPERLLLVTGMSGAGKSTALNTLEDLGWEVVDNLPLKLLDRLLDTPPAEGALRDQRPLAIGIDSRTRGFDAEGVVRRVAKLRQRAHYDVSSLFLDCAASELERRYSETRRPHPLAPDRPVRDGIERERELLAPLREGADHRLDTTTLSRAELQHEMRTRFGEERGDAVLSVMSFGFARGLPRNADLVFDMRFLRNPHWDRVLKPMTGLDAPVGDYIAQDPAYASALEQIEALLLTLLPRYAEEGKAYVTVAFGCTGGRHRSVHVAERVARRLRDAGFSPTVTHRDLATAPRDAVEEPKGSLKDFETK